MKKLIGGAIAVLFGIYGLAVFFPPFLTLLAGIIPLILIIGGGLTIYLNYESDKPDMDDTYSTNVPSPAKSQEPESANIAPEKNIIDKTKDADGKLLGNTETHVFHKSDCNFAESKNCTAVFNARDDAIKEGYNPCRICNP
jgi:hypothetical protein